MRKAQSQMAGGLAGVSWFLLVFHSTWTLALGLDIYKFWRARKSMRIYARSPVLAFVSGVAGIIVQTSVVVQEIMAQEGKVFPCLIILYLHPVVIGLWMIPYPLRGLRAVILSHKEWKLKYLMLLSRNYIFGFLGVLSIFLTGFCAMLQQVVPQVYGKNPTELCLYLGDWWFWMPWSIVAIAVISKLVIELLRLNDKLGLAKEIARTAFAGFICAAPYYTMIILNSFDIAQIPRQTSFLLWVCMALTQANTFMIEPRRRGGEVVCWKKKKRKVVVVIDDAQTTAWKTTWHNSEVIMADPILDQAFEKHAQDYLCSESYDFIKEVGVYRIDAEQKPVEELFVLFRRIVDMYVLAGSELEINIETAMRKKVLQIGDKAHFMEASAERRQDIFNPSRTEIAKMMNENLTNSFFTSRLFLDACKLWQEQQDTEASASTEARLLREIGDGSHGAIENVTLVQQISSVEKLAMQSADDG